MWYSSSDRFPEFYLLSLEPRESDCGLEKLFWRRDISATGKNRCFASILCGVGHDVVGIIAKKNYWWISKKLIECTECQGFPWDDFQFDSPMPKSCNLFLSETAVLRLLTAVECVSRTILKLEVKGKRLQTDSCNRCRYWLPSIPAEIVASWGYRPHQFLSVANDRVVCNANRKWPGHDGTRGSHLHQRGQ